MARQKISEFKSKQIITKALGVSYDGISIDAGNPLSEDSLNKSQKYVVKVDEGVKKRMKQGLVFLDQSPKDLPKAITLLQQKGYTHFIIEPFLTHKKDEEKYLSLSLKKEGIEILYSEKGGIDIEENKKDIKQLLITSASELRPVAESLSIPVSILETIYDVFHLYHFTFLEINPLVIQGDHISFLDIAAEVDTAAEFFIENGWSANDFRQSESKQKTPEEETISELSQKSQASFALNVLNADGSIFMLLSGGGASIVLADEVYNIGYGKQLANYGEYSGNPNSEEVYLYTKTILQLMLSSKEKKKVLIIAGGVANFTDIRLTFAGIVKALEEKKHELQKQNIKVFVRRGGPHQVEGLAQMKHFLQSEDLYGNVSGPEMPLQEIVTMAVKTL